MEKGDSFLSKLTEGQVVERSVYFQLKKLLPNNTIKMTNQERESSERDTYSLVDVVVLEGDQPILGIECKRSETKFRKCLELNGWDGDYNTPLNNTNLRKYKESTFPFYVININQFCHKVLVADIPTILKSNHDKGQQKPSGVIIWNIDCRGWKIYEGDVKLSTILSDIIRREL